MSRNHLAKGLFDLVVQIAFFSIKGTDEKQKMNNHKDSQKFK